jgi:hypothetical protein
MEIGQDALLGLATLAAFGCAPPLLSLLACRKRVRRARKKGVAPGWPLQGLIFSAVAFVLNIALFTVSVILLSQSPTWTRLQAAMLLIGWICFWLWVIVLATTRAQRHRATY